MISRIKTTLVVLLLVAPASLAAAAGPADSAGVEFFEKRIRPLLAERCYQCHSASAEKLKGGLRLDIPAGILAGGDNGAAVVPGAPEKSRLIEAVRYGNVQLQMPPKSKLPDAAIADLEQWVKMGAPIPAGGPAPVAAAKTFDLAARKAAHWSWRPIADPPLPLKDEAQWSRSGADHYILAKLAEKNLKPAADADRRTLIRRATFDVIGLPPRPEDVEAFVNDKASDADAFAKVVDRLLASEHFGERWARHWLDLVRYADTFGHEFDFPIKNAEQYLLYLVRAFNADLPYDQFVREQIAGDLLPKPRMHPTEQFNESILGTGFWFFGEQTHAPVDVRVHQADRIDNQLDVLSKTFLGLTVSCARCHDHKFDAISTKDYYSLHAVAEATYVQQAMLDPQGKIAAAVAEMEKARGPVNALVRAASAPTGDKAAAAGNRPPSPGTPGEGGGEGVRLAASKDTLTLALSRSTGRGDQSDVRLASEAIPAAADLPPGVTRFASFDGADFGDWKATGSAFGARPTAAADWDSLGRKPRAVRAGLAHSGLLSPKMRGILRSPSFAIEKPYVDYLLFGQKTRVRLVVDGYTMDEYSGLLFGGLIVDVNTGGKFVWHRQDAKKFLGHRAHIELIDDAPDGWLAVDEIRFSDGAGPGPVPAELPEVEALRNAPELAAAGKRLDDLAAQLPEPMRAITAMDGTGAEGHVYVRGSPKNLGEAVPRRFLEALAGPTPPPFAEGTSGRLDLARAVTDPTNPLTSRVMVNRVWHHLFGRGIVASVDDFGVMGEAPTHPELLDHLATQFVKDGWSVKKLIRSIVLTRTYQLSTVGSDAAAQADPKNDLLQHARIRRLQSESIRDAILAVSGRLDPKVGGPFVDANLTSFMEGRGRPGSGPLDGAGRRSLYVRVRRNFLPPMMLAFDTPIPFSTMGRRSVSNVPAQALILLNDPFVLEESKRWAGRLLEAKAQTPEQRIDTMYRAAFSRPPTPQETADAVAFLKQQGAEYGMKEEQWANDLRTWTDLAHVLINVKEFVFLE